MAATNSFPWLRLSSSLLSLPQVVRVGRSRGAGAPRSDAREKICTADFLAAGAVVSAAPTAPVPAARAPVPASVAALRNLRRSTAACSLRFVRRGIVCLPCIQSRRGAGDYRVCMSRRIFVFGSFFVVVFLVVLSFF